MGYICNLQIFLPLKALVNKLWVTKKSKLWLKWTWALTHRDSRWKKTSVQVFQGGQSVARAAAPKATVWVQRNDLAVDPAVTSTHTHLPGGRLVRSGLLFLGLSRKSAGKSPTLLLTGIQGRGWRWQAGVCPSGFSLSFRKMSPFPEFRGKTEVQMKLASACWVGGSADVEWLSV